MSEERFSFQVGLNFPFEEYIISTNRIEEIRVYEILSSAFRVGALWKTFETVFRMVQEILRL